MPAWSTRIFAITKFHVVETKIWIDNSGEVKMCYPFLVMMFSEWFCLKDQARYLCICEVFVSKDFSYYFISFRLFNQMLKSFFYFPTVGLYCTFISTEQKELIYTVCFSCCVKRPSWLHSLIWVKTYSCMWITLCNTTCSHRVHIFETQGTWHFVLRWHCGWGVAFGHVAFSLCWYRSTNTHRYKVTPFPGCSCSFIPTAPL